MSVVADARIRRHRLTVEEYHRMGEAGILIEDMRVELTQRRAVRRDTGGKRACGRREAA
jgi:hypothetical protein